MGELVSYVVVSIFIAPVFLFLIFPPIMSIVGLIRGVKNEKREFVISGAIGIVCFAIDVIVFCNGVTSTNQQVLIAVMYIISSICSVIVYLVSYEDSQRELSYAEWSREHHSGRSGNARRMSRTSVRPRDFCTTVLSGRHLCQMSDRTSFRT